MPNNRTPKPEEMLLLGMKPIEQNAFPSHIVYAGPKRVLTPPECSTIIETAESRGWQYGSIGNGGNNTFVDDPKYRQVKCCFLHPKHLDSSGQDFMWLYTKILERAHWANSHSYRFHVSGVNEMMQVLKYEAVDNENPNRPAGHYDLHQDFGGGMSSLRKLSIVIQLSDQQDYEGCQLHLIDHKDHTVIERGQGDMVIFPSWAPHYVTPITKGTRYAIVLWISGPQFQ